MGHGQSRSSVLMIANEESSVRVFCIMDEYMSSSVVVPDDIARRYCLEFERYIGLVHPNTGVYCCELENVDGKIHLTIGWGEFLAGTGASVGDSILFDIRGTDETFVSVFWGDQRQVVRQDNGYALRTGQAQDVGEVAATIVDAGEKGGATPMPRETKKDMANILAAWRSKFVVCNGVELEDRMVEFVAAGMDWELPEYGIYFGKVEGTSITKNRMRLPRLFTKEHVMPLLRGKEKTFYFESETEGHRNLKFSIGKDGRASLTEGWSDFATANGIRAGSILAIRFSDKQTDLDIAIDFLRE